MSPLPNSNFLSVLIRVPAGNSSKEFGYPLPDDVAGEDGHGDIAIATRPSPLRQPAQTRSGEQEARCDRGQDG